MSQVNKYTPKEYLTKKQVVAYKYMWRYTRVKIMNITLPHYNVMYMSSATNVELLLKWLKYWNNVWYISVVLSDTETKQLQYAQEMHKHTLTYLNDVEYHKTFINITATIPIFPNFMEEFKIWTALQFVETDKLEEE